MLSSRTPPPYHVTVQGVEEVSLIGTADLAYWQQILKDYSFSLIERSGRAEMIISAASARFMGKRFRELSFSLFVEQQKRGALGRGAFLLHAFNSSRFFAWVERTFFHTPYYLAGLVVRARGTPEIQLQRRCVTLLNARPELENRAPIREGEEGWEGPIQLWKRAAGDPRRVFYGRLGGHTRVYAFDAARDVFDSRGDANEIPFRWLRESAFQPREWQIREAATHSKSKTILLDGQE